MIQKPRGTVDIYENEAKEFFSLEIIIRNLMDLYNFQEIKTPIFEATELFSRGVGDDTDIVSKEMYTFTDRKNRSLTLRPEGTAPVVRAVLENKMYINEKLPLKLFYFGEMFRYERPQAGRQRQFTQFGLEVFGPSNPEIDSEVICIAVSILNSIGLNDHTVNINYLVNGSVREQYIKDIKKQLSTMKLCDDCQVRINTNPLRVLDCKIDNKKFNDLIDMKDYLSDTEKKHYEDLKKILKILEVKFIEDKLLVRGLDYYTGFVFEIKDNKQSTMLGGGRYNNLVNELGGVDLPAAGFAFGLERIMIALNDAKISLVEDSQLDAYVIALSDKARQFTSLLLLMLRSSNLKVDSDFMNRSLKSAFKQSEKLNARNIIIVGDKEVSEKCLIVKNQKSKTEQKVAIENIVETISKEN